MAAGVNKVILVGNLGRDPEVRYTQSGGAVSNLRLAVTERRKDGEGWKDHTEWVTVVAFGKTAENAGQYLQKGRQIYVEGRLQTRSYKDKEGVEKWSTEVVANQILFLGGGEGRPGGAATGAPRSSEGPRQNGGGAPGYGGGAPSYGAPNGGGPDEIGPGPSSGGGDNGFIDDDLPF